MAAAHYNYALGRRKSSTARVRLVKGKGKGSITINGKTAAEYFADSKALLHELERPYSVLEVENTFDVSAVVSGGGHASQADAIRLGISKALAVMNEDLKSTLRRGGMLGRDPREKERKKYGLKGARKQRQFTKR